MNWRSARRLMLVLPAGLLLAAPGRSGAGPATAPATPVAPATQPDARPVAEGERLELGIVGVEAQNKRTLTSATVERGKITPPLLEPIPVAGLTLAEVAERLTDAYNTAQIIRKGAGHITVKRVAPDVSALTTDDPIVPGERVSVTVKGIAERDKFTRLTRRIGPSGAFPMPFLDDQKLVGLTAEGARKKIVAAYNDAGVVRAESAMVVVVLPDRGESFEPMVDEPATRPAAHQGPDAANVPDPRDVVIETYDVGGILKEMSDGRGGGGGDDAPAKLISTIEQTVDRAMWTDNGGPYGSIAELHGRLIVTALPETQKKVARLLDELQKKQ